MAGPFNPRPRPGVKEALGLLETALADAVRAEQLRDRLTGLANDEALSEWIQTRLEDGKGFWIAFIEVDRFKSINDRYGYDDADILLQRIANQLENAARDFFPDGALPIRAHGDEFYLVGILDSTTTSETLINDALDQVRRNIAAISIRQHGRSETMSCTVSIGWLISSDLLDTGLKLRSIRGKLEIAVAKAKEKRDNTVRFAKEMTAARSADGRTDCPSCTAKFTLTVKLECLREGSLFCPNCGAVVDRPHSLVKPTPPPPPAPLTASVTAE